MARIYAAGGNAVCRVVVAASARRLKQAGEVKACDDEGADNECIQAEGCEGRGGACAAGDVEDMAMLR